MRVPLVAGNWKMNGTKAGIEKLVNALKKGVGEKMRTEIAVCPSHVYLGFTAELLAGSPINLGAQDVCDQAEAGAFTGETAGFMLKDVGCRYTLVGHSERRAMYGESNETVARKFVAAQKAGLIPIFCVGESLEQREQGITEQIVAGQMDAVTKIAGVKAMVNAVVAYEPVWAIGTGKTATPEQAQEVHAFIRARIGMLDKTVAEGLRLLYGGSVKSSNAERLFAMPDIDGGLIGGASLVAEEFLSIYHAAG